MHGGNEAVYVCGGAIGLCKYVGGYEATLPL